MDPLSRIPAARVRQLYEGVLRLFWKGNHVLVASTESPFAKMFRRPSGTHAMAMATVAGILTCLCEPVLL
jgi:hypothetical protein